MSTNWLMRFLLGGSILFAAAEPAANGGGAQVPEAILQVGQFGFLAIFCWYALTKAMPKMQQDFNEEGKRMREHYSKVLDDITTRMEADRIAQRETIEKMIAHCVEHTKGGGGERVPPS